MALSTAGFGIVDISQRTNSLAFATSDCHTCSALKAHCDRQRPRCGTCISSKRKCGGFVMDLTWKDATVPGNAAAVRRDSEPQFETCRGTPAGEKHGFKFVRGRSRRKRRAKTIDKSQEDVLAAQGTPSSDPASQNESTKPTFSIHGEFDALDGLVTSISRNDFNQDDDVATSPNHMEMILGPLSLANCPAILPPTSSHVLPNRQDLSDVLRTVDFSAIDNHQSDTSQVVELSSDEVTGLSPQILHSLDDECVEEDTNEQSWSPVEVLYGDLPHKYGGILTMYDERFCVLPLSADCRNNPFRVRMDYVERFPFLMHAILAVSAQHLSREKPCLTWTDEIHNHWSTAIHLFRTALDQSSLLPLLDTLLTLVSFGATQSAYGVWDMHISGAKRLLQNIEAVKDYQQNSRMRAQIAMLVWWDVTVSLISRREPQLPLTYPETLMGYGKNDGWSFFMLAGCPVEFVVAIASLAKLAETYEQTTRMEWTTFNTHPVEVIVDEIKSYVNEEAVRLDTEPLEEDMDDAQDRFYCIEAWRHAILLYTRRVFKPEQDEQGLRQITCLSRIILDSVRCISPTKIIQKQLLLPVFLAASEVGDEFNRSFVRQYCKHWSDVSHFSQFDTVASLLEDIWSHWSPCTRHIYWWGIRVGGKRANHTDSREEPMIQELLLG